MSSPISFRSGWSSSALASLTNTPNTGSTLPAFPIEVQKRILHFALGLSPPQPPPNEYKAHAIGGQTARQRDVRRVVERLNVHRFALRCMRVCKLWKREATGYLYYEPHLTPSNLFLFTHALAQGDKKWSDINLHPHSVPGRYVISLDLTHLRDGYETPHPTALLRVLREIFPLVPNLAYLKLPTGTFMPLDEIRRAPFTRRLKSLEGVQVNYDITLRYGVDPIVKLLRFLPNLETISILGPGDIDALSAHEMDQAMQDPLNLDNLHTIVMIGVKSGLLLHTLLGSDLPALRQLALTSYANCSGDLTCAFQAAHGEKIESLIYLHPREWPGFRASPPIDTFELHPTLDQLSFLLPKDLDRLQALLQACPAEHPLRSLTLSKWTSTPSDRWESDPQLTGPVGNTASALVASLIASPRRLDSVTVDGFRWVRADLGVRALQTGDSREMRGWSEKLRAVHVDLLDMDGKKPPMLSGGNGTCATGGGVIIDSRGRRRSSHHWGELIRNPSDRLDEDGA